MKTWHWVLVAAVVGGVAVPLLVGSDRNKPGVVPTTETKADSAADVEGNLAKTRYYQAAITAKLVKNALRDPASVQWESVRVNDDGSLVCLVYRATNGFGGMNLAPAVSIGGKISTDGDVWNKHCKGKTLFDLKDEVEIALGQAK